MIVLNIVIILFFKNYRTGRSELELEPALCSDTENSPFKLPMFFVNSLQFCPRSFQKLVGEDVGFKEPGGLLQGPHNNLPDAQEKPTPPLQRQNTQAKHNQYRSVIRD